MIKDSMEKQATDLVDLYLPKAMVMQIATTAKKQPWICSVYFVADEQRNLYWLSFPDRRHSQEIALHADVAVAIAIKTDLPVIGLQAEGRADMVTDEEVVKDVMPLYVEKYGSGKSFYSNFVAGNNQHMMYKFTPRRCALFDEVHFPDNPQQEIIL